MSLKEKFRQALLEFFQEKEESMHIIVLPENYTNKEIELLTEGRWEPSGIKDFWHRLDKPHFDFENSHIHIAHQKHINTKSQQVSWNDDGTRHDKKSFNNKFSGIVTAKQIARDVLKLGDDIVLENIKTNVGGLIVENLEYLPRKAEVYILKIKPKNEILKG